jgi:hypothetical protein
MPAPDPFGIWLEEDRNGNLTALMERHFFSSMQTRKARAIAILLNHRRNGWACLWCGEEVPVHKRSDAKYCSEGCRKRNQRAVRHGRSIDGL